MARNYSSIATEKVLAADVTAIATQITLNNITNLPSPPYTLVINPDTAIEEIVTVDADQSGVTAPTIKVTRAQEGTTAQDHTNGNVVKHMITARDLQEPQDHIASTENVHGISDTAFLTYTNASQTLTNKTMSGSANSFSNIPQSAVTNLVSDLAATDSALTTHSSSTSGIHGVTGSVVGTSDTQTLTNKTLTAPKINDTIGVTTSSTELNILDGVTITTAELNRLSGATSNIQSQLNTIVNVTIPNATPVGTLTMYAGTLAPTGWLICDGTAVSRTTYSALWDVLRAGTSSSPYGNGDGSTTFNLPDLRGRAPIGVGTGRNNEDTANLTTRNRGAKTGTETHQLTVPELPQYNHEYQYSTDGGNGSTYFKTSNGPYSGSLFYPHGSNQPHNNMQPSLAVNFIIKH